MKYEIEGKATKRGKEMRSDELEVHDLIRYLLSLAKLHNNSKTGNLGLGHALRQLAGALKPHANVPIDEIATVLGGRTREGWKRSWPALKVQLPVDLDTTSHVNIERILSDVRYSKEQLMEVGIRRFGISPSRLTRGNRDDVLDVIRAALDHERSIGAISREARRGGSMRSS